MLAFRCRSRSRSSGAGAVAEQPLEHDARVHLRRQRLRRRRPGDRVRVGAAVAPVAVAEVAGVLDAELQRRQDRVLPVLAGDVLIDRDAEERADGVPPRPRPGQQHRAARVIAARLVGRRHRLGHVEAADQHDAVAERLQRLGDERELEVLALPGADSSSRATRRADARCRRTGARAPRPSAAPASAPAPSIRAAAAPA